MTYVGWDGREYEDPERAERPPAAEPLEPQSRTMEDVLDEYVESRYRTGIDGEPDPDWV